MLIAALLALALDGSRTSASGLVLELKLREKTAPGVDPVIELALVNRTSRPLRAVKPGDGSEIGWREPFVFWRAEALAADGRWHALTPQPYGRCGHYAPDWEKDVVELAPGERLVLKDWLRPAGRTFDFKPGQRVRLLAHYHYRAYPPDRDLDRPAGLKVPRPDGPMKDVKPFELASKAVEFTVE